MPDVSRALDQIARIHDQLARGEVYRGWRSLPVALSGLVGIAAAVWQRLRGECADAHGFTTFWLATGAVACATGCAEIAWRYVVASRTDRRRTRRVFGQLAPALAAGAVLSIGLVDVTPAAVVLLPGLWALIYAVGIVSARPFVPPAAGWVAAFYAVAGAWLLVTAHGGAMPSPWTVGGTFGVGQVLAALVLYWQLERERS